jgi:hypothetical protein
MAAITNAATGLNLPAGYTANVVAGTPLPGTTWTTLGVQNVTNLHAGSPQIVAFDLPSNVLPLPASLPGNSHYCLVAFLHSIQDAFTGTQPNVDLLTLADRKVGQKNLHIVEFIGTPPPPAGGTGMWGILIVRGTFLKRKDLFDLVIDAHDFPGTLYFALPPLIFPKDPAKQAKGMKVGSKSVVSKWFEKHSKDAEYLFHTAKYSEAQYKLLISAMGRVKGQPPLVFHGGGAGRITGLPISPKDEHVIFFRIDPPANTKVGSVFEFDISQHDSRTDAPHGASRYRVVVNKKVG